MLATKNLSPACIGPTGPLPESSYLANTQPELVIEEPVTATYRSPEGALLNVPFEETFHHGKRKGQLVAEELLTPTNRRTESVAPRVYTEVYGADGAEKSDGMLVLF